MTEPDEIDRRIEAFLAALRAAGLRSTHQRLEVVREIARSDEHPDVESVYRAVQKRVPTISLDTVYRTLSTLSELGLIRPVAATGGPIRYDPRTSHHHHFVCNRCGLIRDINDQDVGDLPVPVSAAAIGTVQAIEVQFRGICSDCARKESEHE